MAGAVIVIALAVIFFLPEKEKGDTTTVETVTAETTATNANDSSSAKDTASEEATASSDNGVQAEVNENGDVVIPIEDITETATFYQYNSNGTDMALFAVKASDGTIRTAFDTCQVCNGSPYAFFKQQGDTFQCQNCGNIYSLDMIGKERGGCNPVPIMSDEATVTDTEIIIPAQLLEENAVRFENWKKF
ncbi:MAG: putative rane protein [Lachnospiraceae bacterium]|nr:putative rane protein [Lachnospiraceae bacterium]